MPDSKPDMYVLLTMEEMQIIIASLKDREHVMKEFMKSVGVDQQICKDAIEKISKLLDHFITNYQNMKKLFEGDED